MICAVIAGGSLLSLRVHAEDCNQNCVEDSQELTSSCRLDLIFLFDTSGSITNAVMEFLCNKAGEVITSLTQAGADVHAEKLMITGQTPTTSCGCCGTANVPGSYGSSTPCLPETLGSCSDDDGNNEDWAPATAIVAGNKSWTPGAMRIIVPISDEGPRCGDVINDPGDDRDAVNHAIPIVRTNHVIVVPLVSAAGSPNYALASAFAEGGGRCGNVFSFYDAGLVDKIVELVLRHCPADCNANGTLDECDLSAGTSADCYGNSDCVPDECQPSRDCNNNGKGVSG
jgi:hypothetical protein